VAATSSGHMVRKSGGVRHDLAALSGPTPRVDCLWPFGLWVGGGDDQLVEARLLVGGGMSRLLVVWLWWCCAEWRHAVVG
jgi:hypothetical protein